MTKPFSLQAVLELMQVRTDDATIRLAQLIANERDAKNKLDLLRQYRDEYAERFRQAAGNGLSRAEWHNYQEFLGRLDGAIDSQRATVAAQAQYTATGQTHWREQKTKLKAFDTLSERHNASENAIEGRLEQKKQDEFAARQESDKDAG
jgi:flagellar FliJ protein